MLIYDKELKEQLETLGLPVYYNQILDSTIEMPVITYEPQQNVSYLEGFPNHSNLFYSKIDYYIRIWGQSKDKLMPYMEQVDTLMRSLGFRRASYTELASDTQLCLVGLYKATGFERL